MALPIFHNADTTLMMLQSAWSRALNPILALPLNQGIILKSVSITLGATVVNHLLGRLLVGWTIVDIDKAATIYRSAAKNSLTLTLTSNVSCVVDIFVF